MVSAPLQSEAAPADRAIEEAIDGAVFRGLLRLPRATPAPITMIWAHGWGQDQRAFAALADSFPGAAHLLLAFPGFGDAPPPPSAWDTARYAEACEALLRRLFPNEAKLVWIGHSFGGRVGIRMAAKLKPSIAALVLVAAAGLKRKRSFAEEARYTARLWSFKLLKQFAGSPAALERLRARFGSADYRNAGVMRDVLVKVVNEELSEVARAVKTPTLILYGERDTDTPPEFGRRFASLIAGSELHILPQLDHYSILGDGRYLVAKRISHFLSQKGLWA
jgi:pimeloyl-ACP methyl ester carboxylesterase